jgi:hypothetical protein
MISSYHFTKDCSGGQPGPEDKIICSPSYVDIRSRANAAMWLDLDHMTRGEHTREI